MSATDRTPTSFRCGAAATGLVCTLLIVAPSHAQQSANGASAADAAAAQVLFAEAKHFMDASDYPTACAKFAESERLDPAAGTLLNLADCYEKNGQLASAWITFRDAAGMATRTARTTWAEQAVTRARLLEPQVPTLTIRVGADAARDLVITRNGVDAPPSTWGTALPLDPGAQRIAVSAPGKVTWSTSTLVDKEHTHVVVDVPVLEDALPPTTSAETRPAVGSPATRIVSFALLGLGTAAAGVGAILGATAIHKNDEAAARCPTSPICVDPSAVSLTDEARRAATGSTIAFVAGGALLATGAALFFASPSPAHEQPAHAALLLDGHTWGASIAGRF